MTATAGQAPRVRRAVVGDEATVRRVRLEALREAPCAFDSTLQRELARSAADWSRWIAPGAVYLLEPIEGGGRAADPGDGPAADGLAAGVPHDTEPDMAFLASMWVRPGRRGEGAADALVEAVAEWARRAGYTTLTLHVGERNHAARRLYVRRGFVETGDSFIRPRDGMRELEMRRTVGARGAPAAESGGPQGR